MLNVLASLFSDCFRLAPRPFAEHTRAQIDQRHAFFLTLVAVGEAHARADGEVGRNARAGFVGEQGVEDGFGDVVFCQDRIHLLDAHVDFFQTLSQPFNLLGQTLQFGAVNHAVHPPEPFGVEEGRDAVHSSSACGAIVPPWAAICSRK